MYGEHAGLRGQDRLAELTEKKTMSGNNSSEQLLLGKQQQDQSSDPQQKQYVRYHVPRKSGPQSEGGQPDWRKACGASLLEHTLWRDLSPFPLTIVSVFRTRYPKLLALP